ncbi:hypothetical protein [Thalassovita sp.]|jgi:hypothetical protein|uniref:hypothetical protein n=1 Tax=Thalassovita sp. TaxID=1979401 RepID=UPI003B5A397C
MPEKKFMDLISQLESEIAEATDETRHEIQAELHKTVEKMRSQGVTIPARLRELDNQAIDEEMEDRFDNMPL